MMQCIMRITSPVGQQNGPALNVYGTSTSEVCSNNFFRARKPGSCPCLVSLLPLCFLTFFPSAFPPGTTRPHFILFRFQPPFCFSLIRHCLVLLLLSRFSWPGGSYWRHSPDPDVLDFRFTHVKYYARFLVGQTLEQPLGNT